MGIGEAGNISNFRKERDSRLGANTGNGLQQPLGVGMVFSKLEVELFNFFIQKIIKLLVERVDDIYGIAGVGAQIGYREMIRASGFQTDEGIVGCVLFGFKIFDELLNADGVIIEFLDISALAETDMKVTFRDIYSYIIDHKVEFLRYISHNWQREKEERKERKERRKRERVGAVLTSKNAAKQVRL